MIHFLCDFCTTRRNCNDCDQKKISFKGIIWNLKFNETHTGMQTIGILGLKFEGLGDNQEIGSGETIVSKTS